MSSLGRAGAGTRPARFSGVKKNQIAELARPLAAPVCTPFTVTFQTDEDQGPPTPVTLTAAMIGSPGTKGTIVDATGCDVGIYIPSTLKNANMSDVVVHDANQIGILAFDAKNVTINRATIYAIGNHDANGFDPNGVQTGVGIDFEGTSGTITNTAITQTQKNGTAFDYGSTVSVTNTSVVGLGSVNYIADNGFQWYKSKVEAAWSTASVENIYNNPSDPIYDGEATGYLVLCTNISDVPNGPGVTHFESKNFTANDDIPYYISNNTTNGDCPPTYSP